MNHLKKIAAGLPQYGLDAMMLTSAPGEYYAVGFRGEGVVIVTPKKNYYFTDSRYIEAAGKRVTGAEIVMTGGGKNYKKLINEAVHACGIGKLGFEDGYMTVSSHKEYEEGIECSLVPAQKLVNGLRASKDPEEVEVMIKAQRIAERALDEILSFIEPGKTERDLASRLVYDMLRFGADKMSFDPIVVSGPNTSLPHGVPGDRQVQKGDFITMDFGCIVDGYCSDMTRTVALGAPDDEMKKVYHLVLAAQLEGIKAAHAGVPGKSVDAAARAVIEEAGYGRYFGHGFGHSLGIEIHESPNANTVEETLLPVGTVISAEPGIYLPGRFGVRIEDVIVLDETGNTDITKAPKELIVL
ncbi:Aminopeptidase YpdF [bioreactor metagenome]|uniref:Aminopeptidase YpdF n=1 Tax=bioreactor metagenome TaxID=1076179 RepID=A0A644YYZ3_9ZZZZ